MAYVQYLNGTTVLKQNNLCNDKNRKVTSEAFILSLILFHFDFNIYYVLMDLN